MERGLLAGVAMQTTRGEDDGTRNSAVVAGCANPGDHPALAVLRPLRWPHAPPKKHDAIQRWKGSLDGAPFSPERELAKSRTRFSLHWLCWGSLSNSARSQIIPELNKSGSRAYLSWWRPILLRCAAAVTAPFGIPAGEVVLILGEVENKTRDDPERGSTTVTNLASACAFPNGVLCGSGWTRAPCSGRSPAMSPRGRMPCATARRSLWRAARCASFR